MVEATIGKDGAAADTSGFTDKGVATESETLDFGAVLDNAMLGLAGVADYGIITDDSAGAKQSAGLDGDIFANVDWPFNADVSADDGAFADVIITSNGNIFTDGGVIFFQAWLDDFLIEIVIDSV